MKTRSEQEQRMAELVAKNAAATSWGAAVGARHEEIKEIEAQLRQLDRTPPTLAAGSSLTIDHVAAAQDWLRLATLIRALDPMQNKLGRRIPGQRSGALEIIDISH